MRLIKCLIKALYSFLLLCRKDCGGLINVKLKQYTASYSILSEELRRFNKCKIKEIYSLLLLCRKNCGGLINVKLKQYTASYSYVGEYYGGLMNI